MKASTRNKISEGNFAIPEKRKYPIHDAKHARLALAFVSMHGTPDEKSRVRAAVHSKYPDMGKTAAIKEAIANFDSDPEYQRLVGEYHIGRINHLRNFRSKYQAFLKSKATAKDNVSTTTANAIKPETK